MASVIVPHGNSMFIKSFEVLEVQKRHLIYLFLLTTFCCYLGSILEIANPRNNAVYRLPSLSIVIPSGINEIFGLFAAKSYTTRSLSAKNNLIANENW